MTIFKLKETNFQQLKSKNLFVWSKGNLKTSWKIEFEKNINIYLNIINILNNI
jgi:hypothetical protein